MIAYYFVQPTDSLFIRGNQDFGQSGEHGSGVMPPPPSLFAGAFRSAILGRDAHALAAFTTSGKTGLEPLDALLGELNPENGQILRQGSFRLAWVSLAGLREGSAEAVLPLPADLVRLESEFTRLTPGEPNALIEDGRELPRIAALRSEKQEKPQGAIYLRQSGWNKHLHGRVPEANDGVKAGQIHGRDARLGIGLNGDARSAESGLIYTTEGHAFSPKPDPSASRPANEPPSPFAETGFLVGVEGAADLLPESGFLRLGGDGRGANYRRVNFRPAALPLELIETSRRFRLVLHTPGLFVQGWIPNGVVRDGEGWVLRGDGFSAQLVCAAVPRREIISGWDLFQWKPKSAQRVAPAGSVYWFENLTGDSGKLAAWVNEGLWVDHPDPARRAEGYNLAILAAWI